MPKIERRVGERMTRRERLAVVIAILVSLGVHAVVFSSLGGISFFTQKEKRRERMMVIRRLRDSGPIPQEFPPPRTTRILPPEPVKIPDAPQKPKEAPPPSKASDDPGSGPKKADDGGGAKEGQPEAPPEISEAMLRDSREQPEKTAAGPGAGAASAQNVVTVVTDLGSATFLVSGPAENWGSGTYWVRKGLPPGTYTVTFQPAAGHNAPARQSKTLVAGGQIVFVGKYTRNVEVVVDVEPSDAEVQIYRPDGRQVPVTSKGRYFVEDLPPGTYTIVFKDVAGHTTPKPQSHVLSPGGTLIFSAVYADIGDGGRGGSGGGRGGGTGAGTGEGEGGGSPSDRAQPDGTRPAGRGRGAGSEGTGEGVLDRRVQMVVESYPPTSIRENWQPIPYPGVIIRKSNFQQGWCQVYLILKVNADGEVTKVEVERPGPDARSQYQSLIGAVEQAVRGWEYDRVAAEVHVDVRFYVE